MEKLITVGTWLPCFPGFYGTYLEPSEDSELEYIDDKRRELGLIGRVGDYTLDSSTTFKVAEYEEEVAKRYTNLVEAELKEYIPSITIRYQGIVSPKEYNFATDSVNIEVTLSIQELYNYVDKFAKAFKEYIKLNYTSHDGFISRYSNDYTDWLRNFEDTVKHEHQLGAMLQFVLHNEGVTDFEPDLPSLELSDEWYTKLTTMHIVNGELLDKSTLMDRSGNPIRFKELHQLEQEGFVFRSDILENIAMNRQFGSSEWFNSNAIGGLLQKGEELWATEVTVPLYDADCWRVQ